jgi:hypothetical protein
MSDAVEGLFEDEHHQEAVLGILGPLWELSVEERHRFVVACGLARVSLLTDKSIENIRFAEILDDLGRLILSTSWVVGPQARMQESEGVIRDEPEREVESSR